MSLNTIEFSPNIIAELYKSSLVETGTAEDSHFSQPQKPKAWKFLGENKKQILLVMNDPEAVHVSDNQLPFLVNLLKACRLSLGDVAVFNFYSLASQSKEAKVKPEELNELLNYFAPQKIFLFGVHPSAWGLPLLFPAFQIQTFKNITYLYAPPLKEIEADQLLKSKLWLCLKNIFSI